MSAAVNPGYDAPSAAAGRAAYQFRQGVSMKIMRIAAVAALLAAVPFGAAAQQKPIRLMVGLSAGGSLDTMTRLFADKLRVSLGQPVLVENRAGASGLIAIEALKAAPADGSVLLTAASGQITLLPNTFKTPRFDPTKDFVAVAQMAEVDFVLTVNPGVPAKTPAEFAAVAAKDSRYRTFGTAPGTNPHLLATMFSRAAGIDAVHVPYKGNGQAKLDLIGGQIAAAFLTAGEAVELDRGGKARALATTGAKRSIMMPNVPTLKESRFDVEASAWFAFFAPVGTPQEVIDRLSRAIVEAAASADLRERLAHAGIGAAGLPAKELAARIRSEYAQIGKELRTSGFKLRE